MSRRYRASKSQATMECLIRLIMVIAVNEMFFDGIVYPAELGGVAILENVSIGYFAKDKNAALPIVNELHRFFDKSGPSDIMPEEKFPLG